MGSRKWVASAWLAVCAALVQFFFFRQPPDKPCSKQWSPCTESGCCEDPDFSCYQKDKYFSLCSKGCVPGLHDGDPPQWRTPWSCNPHSCSKARESCLETGCCRSANYTCYAKDSDYAQCLPDGSCQADLAWKTGWSCEVLTPGKRPRAGTDRDTPQNVGAVSCRDQTPDEPGAPSPLASFDWKFNSSCSVSEEDVAAYDRDGYVVLHQVLEHEVLDMLYAKAAEMCEKQLNARGVCQIEQVRWQVNLFRDFMFYSSLGCVMHAIIRGAGVRVQTEGLFGLQYNEVDPKFFSYTFHTDQPMKGHGILHGFPSSTKAAAVWFPLHDLDPNETGGSVGIVKGYPTSDCKYRGCGGMVHPSMSGPKVENCAAQCWQHNGCVPELGCLKWDYSTGLRIPEFKKGDVVIWHADMPHRTQRVTVPGFNRYSFTIRFIESDAVLCDPAIACGGPMGCCKNLPTTPGSKVHTPCFPQVYPQVLDDEVAAHYSAVPKHMIADAQREDEISRIRPNTECAGSP